MRATFANIGLLALALAGCSRADEASDAAPDVALASAPGVAFRYRYAFRLPAARLAAAQEAHARDCEALGPARCRVTGLSFRVDGRDSAEGRLELRLAPELARRFGQRAAGGTLAEAGATGTDTAPELERLAAEEAAAAARGQAAARAAGSRDADRRAEGRAAAGEADAARIAARAGAAAQRRALASTPVTLDYASGSALPLLDAGAPLASAAGLLLASARATLAAVLATAALLVPPGLALLAALALFRRLRPLWRRLAGRPAIA